MKGEDRDAAIGLPTVEIRDQGDVIEKRGQGGELRLNPTGDQGVFNGFDDNPLKRGSGPEV